METIKEAVELFNMRVKAECTDNSICAVTLPFNEVLKNRKEAIEFLNEKFSKEELIMYILSDRDRKKKSIFNWGKEFDFYY